MSCPSQSSWLHHPNIWWGVQSIKLFVMQSSPLPCYLIPLRPKYPPQHPILENPQPTFLPLCEWPSFTPIQNNRHLNIDSIWIFECHVIISGLAVTWSRQYLVTVFAPLWTSGVTQRFISDNTVVLNSNEISVSHRCDVGGQTDSIWEMCACFRLVGTNFYYKCT
jgi:hypothetical protein